MTILYDYLINENRTDLEKLILSEYRGVETIKEDLRSIATNFVHNREDNVIWYPRFIEEFNKTGDFFKALELVKDYKPLQPKPVVPYEVGYALVDLMEDHARPLLRIINMLEYDKEISSDVFDSRSTNPFNSYLIEWIENNGYDKSADILREIYYIGYTSQPIYNIIRLEGNDELLEEDKQTFLIKKPTGKFANVVASTKPVLNTYGKYSNSSPDGIDDHISIIFTEDEFDRIPIEGYILQTLDGNFVKKQSL